MLSPAGVNSKPENFTISDLKLAKGLKTPPDWIKKLAKKAWDKKWSPFRIMRGTGKFIGKKIIKSYLNKRMADLNKDEFEAMHEYMY